MYIKIFLEKFRDKYPDSELMDTEIFTIILHLDKNGGLCNGYLTNSRSGKMKKLLAKKRHLLKFLSKVEQEK